LQVCNIARLLAAATPDFLPSLAIGAFAGLRSAEIERLEWRTLTLWRGISPYLTVLQSEHTRLQPSKIPDLSLLGEESLL